MFFFIIIIWKIVSIAWVIYCMILWMSRSYIICDRLTIQVIVKVIYILDFYLSYFFLSRCYLNPLLSRYQKHFYSWYLYLNQYYNIISRFLLISTSRFFPRSSFSLLLLISFNILLIYVCPFESDFYIDTHRLIFFRDRTFSCGRG